MPIQLPDSCLWNDIKVSANWCFHSTGLGRLVLSQGGHARSGNVVGRGEEGNTAGIMP